ncbi:hypothetical protein [Nguyenibacter vanlangensis]|uniref:Lipoprotein n=1 Tax=Nguyenibacter vanlangensis TaxID=1216886 RepID=A0A7Y7IW75_9PROT|nr:hypothetical protein [Nguyenibacter vanlangensis]NVN10950.1 hypothetical protein [Nguyenibacter vanlangensis]
MPVMRTALAAVAVLAMAGCAAYGDDGDYDYRPAGWNSGWYYGAYGGHRGWYDERGYWRGWHGHGGWHDEGPHGWRDPHWHGR